MRDERAWLLDMLLEAQRVRRFVENQTWETFSQDEQAVYAVTKAIENLGEAASQLLNQAPMMRTQHPAIPWSELVGMRNVLAHQYFRIDVARVWKAATVDVPQLMPVLESLVPPEEQTCG